MERYCMDCRFNSSHHPWIVINVPVTVVGTVLAACGLQLVLPSYWCLKKKIVSVFGNSAYLKWVHVEKVKGHT